MIVVTRAPLHRYGLDPSDQGLKAWTYPPAYAAANTILASASTLYRVKIPIPVPMTITNIHVICSTAGATLTTGQNFAALYDSGKALLAVTGDQTTAWESNGFKTMALTAAQDVPAGHVYAAWWANGSTMPTFARATALNSFGPNAGQSAADAVWATADGSLTTTAPDPVGSETAGSASYWVGLS